MNQINNSEEVSAMDDRKIIDAEWTEVDENPAEETLPVWYDGNHLDEVQFCAEFLREHPMICVRGTFYTVDGPVGDEDEIRKQILDKIKSVLTTGLAKTARNLTNALRIECWSPPLPIQQDRIHFANGTLMLDGGFIEDKQFCLNRLPVRYDPSAPTPVTWLRFLDQLLYPEDIPTLQEYMGYCLIPSTKGQKMLLLKGKGGEGKSRIGLVMQAIFGSNLKNGSIAKVESSPFARADLEHELVMVDDDMKLEALTQTHYVKAIVTAEMPMDLERKGVQSYQGQMFVRVELQPLLRGDDRSCRGAGRTGAAAGEPIAARHDKGHGFAFVERQRIVVVFQEDKGFRRALPVEVSEHLRGVRG